MIVAGIQDAFDHALDGRKLQLGGVVGHQVAKFLDVVDFVEGLKVFQLHVLERIGGLLAESRSVDEE